MVNHNLPKLSDSQKHQVYQLLKYLKIKIKYKRIDLLKSYSNQNRKLQTILNEADHTNPDVNQAKLYLDTLEENIFDIIEKYTKLTNKQKKVIILYFQGGYSQKEISTILNISESAISQLKARALQNLKIELERKIYG